MQKTANYEIERRFLIRMPDRELLEKKGRMSRILQTYLLSTGGETARVRRREENGIVTFTHTVKKRVSAIKREEYERVIDEEEYTRLLLSADPKRRAVDKLRYCLDYEGHCFEIDIFSFFSDRAIIEIELSHEEESFTLPPEFELIREISGDKRYTNAAMALEIPDDPV